MNKKIYKEGVKILNLPANVLVNKYEITNNRKNAHMDGTLPFSLLTIKLQEEGEKFIFEKLTNSVNTYCIVNVDFNCSYKEIENEDEVLYFTDGKKVEEKKGSFEVKMNSAELREYLYQNGFTLIINNKEYHYSSFCRSAAKSRTGNRLFIRTDLLDSILYKYMRMSIEFDKDELLDVPSWLTYESLVCSSIIDTVKINLDNICVVDDVDLHYKDIVSVTRLTKDGLLTQKDELYDIKNTCTDGEIIINSKLTNYCMELLRNHFFKGCGISTDLQLAKKILGIEYFVDKWGNKFEEPDLIITPSSLKLFKFAYKFNDDREMFEYWKTHCNKEFGIVKHNKPSGRHEGKYGQLSYQVLNSLYTATYNDILSLMGNELQYLNKLKSNDEEYFKLHINNTNNMYTDDFINTMVSLNRDFYKTKMYRKYKSQVISQYITNLKCSKICIKDFDYYTIFGNIDLLVKKAAQLPIDINLEGNYCYCPSFPTGIELFAHRNPHVSSGNLVVMKNEYFSDLFQIFDKLSQGNVCILNCKSSLQDAFSGADFDSDVVSLCPNKTLIRLVKENIYFKPPVCALDYKKKMATLSAKDTAKIDFDTSKNLIGEVVNLSSLILSYFCDFYNKDKNDSRLKKLADLCNMMSCASTLEIDKAKKNFDVEAGDIIKYVRNELSDILEKEVIQVSKHKLTKEEKDLFEKTNDKSILIKEKEAYIKPMFFKYAQSDYADQYAFRLFNTPSDYVISILDNFKTRLQHMKTIEVDDLILKQKDFEHSNRHQIQKIIDVLKSYKNEYVSIKCNKSYDTLEKMLECERIHNNLLETFEKMRITDETIYCMLMRMFNKNEGKKIIDSSKNKQKTEENIKFLRNNRLLILNTLCKTHKEEFKKCFNNFKQDVEVLVPDETGPVEIWGKKYRKEII